MSKSQRGPFILLGILIGLTAAVAGLFALVRFQRASGPPLPVIGRLEGFRFTNQLGQPFDTRSLAGTPWVADLIFTRCPGPCLKLTRNLATLQARTAGGSLRLVSLTADPEFDTPAVLKGYAERAGADPARWQFLTGPRAEINRVAMRQLLLALEEKEPAQRETEDDLYLHSTKWVLVDGQGRLRAVYEGTEPQSVGAVVRDLRRLQRESSP